MIYKDKDPKNILNQISFWSHKFMSFEICGFLGLNKKEEIYCLKLCKNNSTTPNENFYIDPLEFLSFKEDNHLIGVFHSHTMGDEKASEFDVMSCENCCLPFIIYSLNTNNFNIIEPKVSDSHKTKLKELKQEINKTNDKS